jgi:regulator of protease activity HflC (stomatin/prohibitin superfamily)
MVESGGFSGISPGPLGPGGRSLLVADDQFLYRRGTTAALVGLAIQVGLVVATAMVGLWTRSPAIQAATWHMLIGVPIWIILAVVYSQSEAERRETLAAEKLAAADAASAAIFGESSDELQQARQRLAALLGYGLPAVSFLVAISLIVAGLTLLWRFAALAAADDPRIVTTIVPTASPVALVFVSGAIAFVAFVAARWISGYTRVSAWRLLRGGASYLMSCFLLAALVLVGAIVAAVLDDTRLFRVIAIAVPAVMLLVGLEILLTGLLEAYRPRRPGEIPRPAFDSRVLGLLTSPESLGQVVGDLINYQFGVEVSRSWLFRLLGRAVTPLTILGAGVLSALSCLVVVGPDEQGVVTRFGAVRGEVLGPGLHAKLPWPVEAAATHPVGRVLQIMVSSDAAGRAASEEGILWTSGDDRLATIGMEYYPAPLDTRSDESANVGLALVGADVVVQYRVRDLLEYLRGAVDPGDTLAAIAQQEASRYFACHDLDGLLTLGRTSGGPALERSIQAQSDALGLGLDVVGVAVTSLRPPGGRVARAFHRQIGAQQERQTRIQEGRREAVATLARVAGSVDHANRINAAIVELDELRSAAASDPDTVRRITARELDVESLLGEARGEAAELVHAARGYRWSKAVGERSARERFAGELLAYEKSPEYYRVRRFLDVLADGLAERRKFIIAGDHGDLPILQMDFSDPTSAIDTLLGE